MTFNLNEYSYADVIQAYEILEVPLCSEFEMANKAYKKLALKWHPDRNANNPQAEEKFKEACGAKDYLENYKDNIIRDKTTIIEFKNNPVASSTSPPSSSSFQDNTDPVSADFAQSQEPTDFDSTSEQETETEEEQEVIHESEEEKELKRKLAFIKMKAEIEQLLNIFSPQIIPEGETAENIHYGLTSLLNSLLQQELPKVDMNIRLFASKLNQKKNELEETLNKLNNYYPSQLFPESNLRRMYQTKSLQKELAFYSKQLSKLLGYKGDLEVLLEKTQCTGSYYYCSDLLNIDNLINDINTLIASTQCQERFDFEITSDQTLIIKPLTQALKLQNISRLTDDFLNQDGLQNQFKTLDLSNNVLFRLSPQLRKWQSLENLLINHSPLIGFPEVICDLINLKFLHLEGNGITQLPENISKLIQLEELNCSNNHLTQLPKSLKALSQLRILDLSHNAFQSIPEVIGQLNQLIELNFGNGEEGKPNNSISEIPLALSSLTHLQILMLNHNNIVYIPEEVIAHLKSLRTLSVRDNHLHSLPKNIGDLTNLKIIDAQNNLITFVPASILKLKNTLQNCLLNNNLLHQNPLPVIGVLTLMGTPEDQIQCLFTLQDLSPTQSSKMAFVDGLRPEDDKDLLFITHELQKHLNFLQFEKTILAQKNQLSTMWENYQASLSAGKGQAELSSSPLLSRKIL